jgi:hypothetical protein
MFHAQPLVVISNGKLSSKQVRVTESLLANLVADAMAAHYDADIGTCLPTLAPSRALARPPPVRARASPRWQLARTPSGASVFGQTVLCCCAVRRRHHQRRLPPHERGTLCPALAPLTLSAVALLCARVFGAIYWALRARRAAPVRVQCATLR